MIMPLGKLAGVITSGLRMVMVSLTFKTFCHESVMVTDTGIATPAVVGVPVNRYPEVPV